MKNILLVISLLTLVSCNNDDLCCVPFPESRIEQMEGRWILQEAINSKNDPNEWVGFTVKFSLDKTYSTENSPDFEVWPQTGTFEFAGEEGTGLDFIIRSDQVRVHIDHIAENALHLSINIDVKNEWVFKMIPF